MDDWGQREDAARSEMHDREHRRHQRHIDKEPQDLAQLAEDSYPRMTTPVSKMITFPQNGTYPFIRNHNVRVHSYAQPRRAGDRKATVISLGAYTFERGEWTPIKDIIDEWHESDSIRLRLGGADKCSADASVASLTRQHWSVLGRMGA